MGNVGLLHRCEGRIPWLSAACSELYREHVRSDIKVFPVLLCLVCGT
jgi:hypothetical protein